MHPWMIYLAGIIGGLFLIGLGLPMYMKKVKPNPVYGFRTRKTLSNEAVWYDANRYAGRCLILTGVFGIVMCLAVFVLQRTGSLPPEFTLKYKAAVIGAGYMIAVILMLIFSLLHLRKL